LVNWINFRLVLHSINNFLISQLNLLALPQKDSFRKLPLFKGDKKQYYSFKHHHAIDLNKKTQWQKWKCCSPKENNCDQWELNYLMILEHDAHWNYKKKQVKYFLEYKFPIEQLLSQNKFIWITKMYFIF